MGIPIKDIRNFAIAGHNGTGKTALFDQLLFYGDEISKPELTETGRTTSDYTEEEIARKISVHAALGNIKWMDRSFSFVDTPGTADFVGEVTGGFRSCESTLLVVDAREGAQIETIKLWRDLNRRNKPRAVFLNKMDKDRVDYRKTFEALREEFKVSFVPITIPMGEGPSFKGVINLIEAQAYTGAAAGKKETAGAIPSEFNNAVSTYTEILMESAAVGADDLLEKYLEEFSLSADEIRRGIREGLANNTVVPVFCGCSSTGAGFTSLLNFIANNFPTPAIIVR